MLKKIVLPSFTTLGWRELARFRGTGRIDVLLNTLLLVYRTRA